MKTSTADPLPEVFRAALAVALPAVHAMNNEKLTPREAQVLRLLACGFTYSQAAERLGVSPHTITTHIKNLYRKLDVHCAAGAVMRGVQLRLLGDSTSTSSSSAPV
jgi:DNA-binding NarL/FixJ family response regulator